MNTEEEIIHLRLRVHGLEFSRTLLLILVVTLSFVTIYTFHKVDVLERVIGYEPNHD